MLVLLSCRLRVIIQRCAVVHCTLTVTSFLGRSQLGTMQEQAQPAHSDDGAHPTSVAPLILASASPRRRELLAYLDVKFTIVATDAEEETDQPSPDLVAQLPPCSLALLDHPTLRAWRKLAAVRHAYPDRYILAADTVVVLDDVVLNKPQDPAHARAMLQQLSGRVHTVYTGICVTGPETGSTKSSTGRLWFDLVASAVRIADLDPQAIAAYVDTGEPLDKAGSYGIQGLGGRLVEEVRGSYTAVVGLPLPATHRLLVAAGLTGLCDPAEAYRNWIHAQGKEPLPCPPTLP